MPTTTANGIDIAYETHGDPAAPTLLAIHGLGAQLTDWPDHFVQALVDQGFRVVSYDNRDQGRSTWFDEAGDPDLASLLTEGSPAVPYLIPDMAADAAGLLDALGVARAHVLGVSMGGMIAQQFAIDYPDRTISLTSIMSTPNPGAGPPTPEAAAALLVPPAEGREAVIEQSVAGARIIGSPGFPFDEAAHRARAAVHYDRGNHPVGTARQLAAILASPDRTDGLAQVAVPTLVVHGEDDPLVTLPGGEATATAVPDAELWVIPGMGHDLPEAIVAELAARQGKLLANT